MFTARRRASIRDRMLERARIDPVITCAALTGSKAGGTEDRWSDIDLFFGVADGLEQRAVLEEWSVFMYEELGALHHFDLEGSPAIYRAFLLPTALEVDLGFTTAARFGPSGPNFQRVFGEAVERERSDPPRPAHVIGLAWHHVLHARVAIERNKLWQAEYWISAARDQTLTLACIRLGAPDAHGRGFDLLPSDVTADLEAALIRSLGTTELRRALRAAAFGLRREVSYFDADLARRLERPLIDLAGITSVPTGRNPAAAR